MRWLYFFFMFMGFLSSAVFASTVNVDIEGVISSVMKETHTVSQGLLSGAPEVYNTGSLSYAARTRLSVANEESEIFSAWSAEEDVLPGERENFKVFAYLPSPGSYTARLFGHYANDAFLLSEYNFSIKNTAKHSSAITLSKPRVYEDKISVSVAIDSGEKNIILMPAQYPKTWVFEQRAIQKIGTKPIRVLIPYDADIFSEKDIALIAVSEDGEAFGQIEFKMKRERGFYKYVSLLNDWLQGAE